MFPRVRSAGPTPLCRAGTPRAVLNQSQLASVSGPVTTDLSPASSCQADRGPATESARRSQGNVSDWHRTRPAVRVTQGRSRGPADRRLAEQNCGAGQPERAEYPAAGPGRRRPQVAGPGAVGLGSESARAAGCSAANLASLKRRRAARPEPRRRLAAARCGGRRFARSGQALRLATAACRLLPVRADCDSPAC